MLTPAVRPALERQCVDWRWIGVKEPDLRDDPCPRLREMDGWSVRPLFAPPEGSREPRWHDVRVAVGRGTEELPLPLRDLCLYEHEDEGGDLGALEVPGLVALERDCMAVTPQGSELARRLLPRLEGRFLSQAGRAPLAPGAPDAVRLAVVDSHPDRARDPEGLPANSPHGRSLAGMARRLLCPDGVATCGPQITTRLALAYLSFDRSSRQASRRDAVRGGRIGLIGELAEALWAELGDWQQGAPAGQRLVLNLSLGWSPRFGGSEPLVSSMPPAVQAVYRVLENASCRGALVVAAAGNDPWGPQPGRGPLLPGGWEERPAPSPARCAAFGLPAPILVPGSYRPLLVAAAGVEPGDRPLANARPGSEPRLVAFADHAAVASPLASEPPGVLTGSSISTLVVSAAAAAVWRYRPDDPQEQVVAGIYGSARDLGRAPAVCLRQTGAPCPSATVRRVEVCRAAAAACANCQGAACPATCPSLPCPAPPAPGVEPRRAEDLFAQAPRESLSGPRTQRSSPACPPQGARERLLVPLGEALPATLCPRWNLPDLLDDIPNGGQPGSNPCPSCTLDPPSQMLFVEIEDGFTGVLSAPTLTVGERVYPLDLDLGQASQAVITGVAAAPGEQVLLSFVVDGTRSVTVPVLVP